MSKSELIHNATVSLETPSGKLLGFAFHPSNRAVGEHLANLFQPSFVIEVDDEVIELIYLVDGTNDEISAIRSAIEATVKSADVGNVSSSVYRWSPVRAGPWSAR